MNKKLRFTGEWPPPDTLLKFPNWEFALDEEGAPGQDETTLRPASEQNFITANTAYTAGEITAASGTVYPAILELFDTQIEGISALVSSDKSWRIRMTRPTRRWVPYVEEWLPESERSLAVSFDDSSLFPFTVRSVLPRSPSASRWILLIENHGFAKEIEEAARPGIGPWWKFWK